MTVGKNSGGDRSQVGNQKTITQITTCEWAGGGLTSSAADGNSTNGRQKRIQNNGNLLAEYVDIGPRVLCWTIPW